MRSFADAQDDSICVSKSSFKRNHTMMIAQITDLHVRPRGKVAYERVDTTPCSRRRWPRSRRYRASPTGDRHRRAHRLRARRRVRGAARHPRPLSMPVHLVPGDHDRRAELFADRHGRVPKNDDGFQHY